MKTFSYSLLLFFLIPVFVFPQKRENRSIINVTSKSERIYKAIGWEQNETTGKWISNENVIYSTKCKDYYIDHVYQNFKWIQFIKVNHNWNDYYVFMFERRGGYYRYPNIQEDWVSEKQVHFFILSTHEYNMIKSRMHERTGNSIVIKSKHNGHLSSSYQLLGEGYEYNMNTVLNKIHNTIDGESYFEKCFVLNSQNIDGQNIVRFRLPDYCYNSYESLNKGYFEISYNIFINILID